MLPNVDFLGGDLIIKSSVAAGKTLQLTKIVGDKIILGPADAAVLAHVGPGDKVQVDNSNFLARQTYDRPIMALQTRHNSNQWITHNH